MFELNWDLDIVKADPFDDDYFNKSETKNRIRFDLTESFERLSSTLMLPKENESIRMISPQGGWSSCSLTMWIAHQAHINNMIATTLRVGKKEIDKIAELKQNGKIDNIHFVMCDISRENKNKQTGKDYNYDGYIESVAKENNIKITYKRNHSKVILLDTDKGKFIIETSSNFNENPKIEQFVMTASKKIYDYYIKVFKKLEII